VRPGWGSRPKPLGKGWHSADNYVYSSCVSTSAGALDGLVVADFSRVLAGPYLTMLLGDLGATVIKVESRDGDQTRGWGPPWTDSGSTYYQCVNRNKQSVVLDLKEEADQKLAMELARRADVLVENLLPGRMQQFGLDYPAVSALNDRIIYCSVSGFGSRPQAAALPGFDLVAQAASGLMSITGEADRGPLKVGVAVVDIACGLHAGLAVLAALASRNTTGRGQLVEVNLLTSALSVLTNQIAGYSMAGVTPGRAGNAHPNVAPYESFSASDGDIVIAAGTEQQFAKLCEVLELGSLVRDERFGSNSARVVNRPVLRDLIGQAVQRKSRSEIVQELMRAGVPAAPVNDVADALDLANALGLQPLWKLGGNDHVRAPFWMSDTPPGPNSPPPQLDEHGDAIRAWLARGDYTAPPPSG
jgi:crotonobetainyl-CoA:carnitine CoA-transferase CaiB-like acyl-CoA transferase